MGARTRKRVNLYVDHYGANFPEEQKQYKSAKYLFFTDDSLFGINDKPYVEEKIFYDKDINITEKSLLKEYKNHKKDYMKACYREKIPFRECYNFDLQFPVLLAVVNLVVFVSGFFWGNAGLSFVNLGVAVPFAVMIALDLFSQYSDWKDRWR